MTRRYRHATAVLMACSIGMSLASCGNSDGVKDNATHQPAAASAPTASANADTASDTQLREQRDVAARRRDCPEIQALVKHLATQSRNQRVLHVLEQIRNADERDCGTSRIAVPGR